MGEPEKQARNLIDLAMESSLGQITALEGAVTLKACTLVMLLEPSNGGRS